MLLNFAIYIVFTFCNWLLDFKRLKLNSYFWLITKKRELKIQTYLVVLKEHGYLWTIVYTVEEIKSNEIESKGWNGEEGERCR